MEEVLRAEVKKSAAEYIGRWQATEVQWVALLPILEVCASETGYHGGLWWGSEAKVVVEAANELGDTVEHVGGGRTGEGGKRYIGVGTEHQ